MFEASGDAQRAQHLWEHGPEVCLSGFRGDGEAAWLECGESPD